MNWLLSLVAALIAGAVGLLVSGYVAALYAAWYHVTTREGAAGFLIVGIALLGGIVSTVFGLIVSRVVASGAKPGFGKALACSVGGIVALGGLVTLALYWFADIPPTIGGDELRLEAEIRLPAGTEDPSTAFEGEPEFVLGSAVNHRQRAAWNGELKVAEARQENGRWIVPAEVFLFTSRGLRVISASIGETKLAGFVVPLAARPGPEDESWSGWGPQTSEDGSPWADAKPSYRFRVQRIPPPPPPPTEAEMASEQESSEQAAFDAIAPDSPISAWLPYTPEWQNASRRALVIGRITERPDYVAELGRLMRDDDPRQAESALRFVGQLPEPDPALVPEVRAAGRDIAERIEKVNTTSLDQDPGYEGAADVSIRFGGWMVAVRALREKAGADFTPELGGILVLSRVREDSYSMAQMVRRVASYYMHTWAGVEPLPGDPPPK